MTRTTGLAFIAAAVLALPPAVAFAAARTPQPLPFPHRVHVATYGIDCRFCHVYAGRSAPAGIPPAGKCMACHRSIAAGKPEGKTIPAVARIAAAAKEGRPIAWNRVAFVPDHVYFPHFKMVGAGIPCLTCHPGMDRAEEAVQTLDFTMGWCMKCHRQRGVSIDCWTCHK